MWNIRGRKLRMEQLKNACLDIWAAGSDTTTNTITWTVLYVLHHPEVTIKMYEELDANIGGGRLITLNDKHKLSYISAVINVSEVSSDINGGLRRKKMKIRKFGTYAVLF